MQQGHSTDLSNPLITKVQQIIEEKVSYLSIFKFADSKQKMYMFIGSITSVLAGITFPFFLMFFGKITDVFTDRSSAQDKGFSLCIQFIIIGVSYWALSFGSLYSWSYSGSTQSMRLKKLYYQTLLQQQVAWYDSIDVGKLASTVAKNINMIENAIGEKVALLISAIFTSAFGIIFAFVHCWELSLFLCGILPIAIYSGFLLMRSYGLRSKCNNASYQIASGIAEQAFNGIKTVKYLVGQAFQISKFLQALKEGNRKAIRYIIFVSLFLAAFSFVQLGLYSIGMWLGKWVLIWNEGNGRYTAADIIGTFFCVVSGGSAFGQISPILKNLAEGKQAFKDLSELMNRKRTLDQFKGGYKIYKIQEISLKKVRFNYKQQELSEKSILKNLSLQFIPNKVNAIVGESGSGKSTIIQLLMRFYDCSQGQISINQKNIRNTDIQNLRRRIGYVGQQPVLFAMNIQDNLRLANPDMTDDQIIESLKKANAWDFVEKMEKGIKTYVGSGGAQLSGGQKQRIAIARALCKNPQLLILDEATSALDRKNQKEIQQTLQKLSQSNITTLVVAHRLSTIKNADKIFVLDKGELIEQGNHQQLISLNSTYSRLVHAQISAEQKGILLQQIDHSEQIKLQINDDDESQSDTDSAQQKLKRKQLKQKQQTIKQKAVFRKLLMKCKPYYVHVVIGALCCLINGCVIPMFTIAFGNILALLNDVSKNEAQINQFCIYFLIVAIMGSLTNFTYNFCFGVVGDRLVLDLRTKVFDKLLKMPIKYFDKKQNTPGAISTKLSNEAYQIHNMVTGIIAIICLNSTTIAVSLIIAMYNCWQIALVTLAFTPILMLSTSIHVAIVKRIASKSQRSEKLIGSLISDTVTNIRTVKSFGRNQFFIAKFQENLQQLAKVAFQRSLKTAFFQGMRRAMIVIIQGFIFWIVGTMYTKDILHQQSNSIFIAIFTIIYSSNTIGQSSQHMPDLAKAKRSGAILFNILETKDQVQISKNLGGNLLKPIEGNIQFKSVSFRYPERDVLVLDNFSISISAGEKIGLVGESGSGKSTVAQLLMRLYEPISGQILIDGHDLKEYDLYHLRKSIGIVNQQPTLFRGRVNENIQYNQQFTKQEMQQSLRISCCSKFINDWQQGLEKEVGQKGSQVSGGQKQRLAIARCIIRRPKIVLFDQSTSALDAETESNVFQNLKQGLKNVTSLSIAHRLSTIKDASKIIMMKDGRIIEEGNYGQLLRMKGNFYRLALGK